MNTTLPPGVSAGTFAAAIREFQAAVGADWVFTSEDDLETYRDP
jgi:4-cresol dehydrogenase (hydroxylating)